MAGPLAGVLPEARDLRKGLLIGVCPPGAHFHYGRPSRVSCELRDRLSIGVIPGRLPVANFAFPA
jgi:hypothetical protein